jgi:hypothetical protein
MAKFGHVANMQTNEESSLDILDMYVGTNEGTKEVVNKELLMFRRFQMDVEEIKCSLKWWVKHESLFPTMAFLAHQIFCIIGSQIETKIFLSLARILTNLKRCHLQSDNLDKIIFVNKNWPSDPRVGTIHLLV